MIPVDNAVAVPSQLRHERDVLGYVPARMTVARPGIDMCGTLHEQTVTHVRKAIYADFHTLTFALGGGTLCRLDARGQPAEFLPPGTVAIQPADVESIWHSAGPARWMQCYLSTRCVEEAAASLGIGRRPRLERRLAVDDTALVKPLYACATQLAQAMQPDALQLEQWSDMLAHYLAGTCAHTAPAERDGERLSRAQLARALDYIEAHLGAAVTASAVARALDLSRFHFSRGFTGALGISPYRHIQQQRLRAAQRLIVAGEDSLAEIACTVGYASQAHMTAAFRQHLGVSPGTLRGLGRKRFL